MIIIGSGMAGLLAANMLARHKPVVLEAQSSLPSNHSAVLRFKSGVVGDVLSIPFKRVNMLKTSLPFSNNVVKDALVYARKCGGVYRSDRSIASGTVSEERFIAPPDLVARMSEGLKIHFNCSVSRGDFGTDAFQGPIISTIPMPALMSILEYDGPRPEFRATRGWNVSAMVEDCEAYATVMVPDPEMAFYRVSVTGNQLIAECTEDVTERLESVAVGASSILFDASTTRLRDVAVTEMRYAKIQPIDEGVRRDFLHWATMKHRAFSLGRFATWRPRLLLDDLIKDVRLIERWSDDRYAWRREI